MSGLFERSWMPSRNASSWEGVPWTSTSTSPSSRFWTQPTQPALLASSCAWKRKPRPGPCPRSAGEAVGEHPLPHARRPGQVRRRAPRRPSRLERTPLPCASTASEAPCLPLPACVFGARQRRALALGRVFPMAWRLTRLSGERRHAAMQRGDGHDGRRPLGTLCRAGG